MTYRQRADAILALSFLCFGLAFIWWYVHGTTFLSELIFFVFQSALIGSIADWFAVTALFRRPLGFPWHTALIPRNRQRIAESIAAAVQDDLLDKKIIQDRLASVRFVHYIIDWVENKNGKQVLSDWAVKCLNEWLSRAEPDKLAVYWGRFIKKRLAAEKLAVLNPLAVLARGYSITRTPAGRVVRRAADAAAGQHLEVVLQQGRLDVEVIWAEEEYDSGKKGPQPGRMF